MIYWHPHMLLGSVLSHLCQRCGATEHPYVSTPYWSHALVQWGVEHLGTRWFWMWYTKRMNVDVRRRALRKAARENAKKE